MMAARLSSPRSGVDEEATSEGTSTLSFANDSVEPMIVERFSTSVAAVIVATAIAVMVAARKPAVGSAVKRITDTSRLPRAKPTTAIVSRTTVNAGLKPA